MADAQLVESDSQVSLFVILRNFVPHWACLALPLISTAYLVTGPHPWYLALLWLVPLGVAVAADTFGPDERHQPVRELPNELFNLLLYVLVAIVVANAYLAVQSVATNGFFSFNTVMIILLVATASGYTGITAGHELIHRQQKHLQLLGRALLCVVLYEHFYTEHNRGHHVRVGTKDDPATAEFGESFNHFIRRTIPAQFKSAWRLETERLGDVDMSVFDPRILRSRIVHGLAAEWALAFAVLYFFGWGAFFFWLIQAAWAVRLLECVNYFEHWGLVRQDKRILHVDSWDTDSMWSLYGLIGLSRHADHHARPALPYEQLRRFDETPKLPRGYFGMVPLAVVSNNRFQKLMTEELKRRRLGPFTEEIPVPQ